VWGRRDSVSPRRSDSPCPRKDITDLPVLLPAAAKQGRHRNEDVNPIRMGWHGGGIIVLLVLASGVAEAATEDPDRAPISTLMRWLPLLLKGFSLNLLISFLAMALGTAAGLALGLLQVSIHSPVRAVAWALTQFFRNSPWLVLLFAVMLLFPFELKIAGTIVPVPGWIKATIGFALPVMANISEIVRGAVQSISTGQWESAESLAFTRRQILWLIILPQCVKRILPPWMNWYAILTMATPLCSILGVEEVVNYAQQAMIAENSRPELLAPFYMFVLTIFFLYCYPIARLTSRLERRYAVDS
jgi:polar amino acid transport system permease protein